MIPKRAQQPDLFNPAPDAMPAPPTPPPQLSPLERETVVKVMRQTIALYNMQFGTPKFVRIACPCSFRPYPHIFSQDEDQRSVRERHQDGKRQ